MLPLPRPYVKYKNGLIGWRVDFDWAYWYQCVDLFKDYCKRVLGITMTKTWNANEIWNNTYNIFDNTWTKIIGTDDLMQWDIIIRETGKYWHIWVVDRYLSWKILVLEQNGSMNPNVNWTDWDEVRVQSYKPEFWTGVWRCQKIFDNLQAERAFIDAKLATNPPDSIQTQMYKDSIRYEKHPKISKQPAPTVVEKSSLEDIVVVKVWGKSYVKPKWAQSWWLKVARKK